MCIYIYIGEGRVWMTPEEIAVANNQAPPVQTLEHMPSHPFTFNASEIVMQSKRETCPCRDDPFPCMCCQGVRRAFYIGWEGGVEWECEE